MKDSNLIKLIPFLLLVFISTVSCTTSSNGIEGLSEGLSEELSPLMEAVEQGDIAEIQRLLDEGYDINETTKNGTTPVTYAVLLGKREVVEFLIDNGADVNIPDKRGMTAPMFAAMGRDSDLLETILDRVDFSKESMSDLMILALWVGDLESTELLLNYGASATTEGERSGITPLTFVIENRFLEAVELF